MYVRGSGFLGSFRARSTKVREENPRSWVPRTSAGLRAGEALDLGHDHVELVDNGPTASLAGACTDRRGTSAGPLLLTLRRHTRAERNAAAATSAGTEARAGVFPRSEGGDRATASMLYAGSRACRGTP
jgi:hypothetical protein